MAEQDVSKMLEEIKRAERLETQYIPGTPEKKEDKRSFLQKFQDGDLSYDDIPDNIKEDWFRSIIGNTPFTYKVKVFNGKISFVFCDIDQEGMQKYSRMSARLGRDINSQTKLGICVFLHSIVGEINHEINHDFMKLGNPDTITDKEVADIYDHMCADLPVGLTRMLPAAWGLYSSLVGLLTDNAMPDSF